MTMKELYAAIGADYDDVLGRLRSERLVQKFVLKFPNDENYSLLCTSMENGDTQEAIRAAHTIKGMCLNLGFVRLGHSSDELTEALRAGKLAESKPLFEQVKKDYAETIQAIQGFQA